MCPLSPLHSRAFRARFRTPTEGSLATRSAVFAPAPSRAPPGHWTSRSGRGARPGAPHRTAAPRGQRPAPMLQSYAPILLLALVVAGFAAAGLILSDLLGKKRRAIGKAGAYESGMDPQGNARVRLSIHFYLIAVLFILFDVESIFLIPWAATARELAAAGVGQVVFLEVLGFVGVLAVGLAYVWRKGGLEWDR